MDCQVIDFTDFAQVAELISRLPEISEIRDPIMNAKMCYFLSTTTTKDLQNLEQNAQGLIRFQSRFEVLWRTLLLDTWHGQHPAPSGCGEGLTMTVRSTVGAQTLGLIGRHEFNNLLREILQLAAKQHEDAF